MTEELNRFSMVQSLSKAPPDSKKVEPIWLGQELVRLLRSVRQLHGFPRCSEAGGKEEPAIQRSLRQGEKSCREMHTHAHTSADCKQ